MISRVGAILILVVVIVVIRSDRGVDSASEGGAEMSPLAGQCFNNIFMAEWWSYVWCYGDHVRQIHFNHHSQRIESENQIGSFVPEESGERHHIYRSEKADCISDEKMGTMTHRYAEVTLECCEETGRHIPFPEVANEAGGTVISEVREPVPCSYYVTICSEKLCDPTKTSKSSSSTQEKSTSSSPSQTGSLGVGSGPVTLDVNDHGGGGTHITQASFPMDSIFLQKQANIPSIPDLGEQGEAREKVREMFYHGYDSYIANAFPEGDLNPLSCKGEPFDLIKIPLVTLIDSLDTLVIMGNHSEFRRAVSMVCSHYPSFDLDVNVSVFETTIRVLGGLLSAHLMAIDDSIGLYNSSAAVDPAVVDTTTTKDLPRYDGSLMRLAVDLGERLLPAFQTNTGIPYGTVNLRYGVPKGETEIASTAGAGSLLVEFEALSSLSGERKYGDAAYAATRALYDRRSSIGLLGKHIHTDTGRWFESVSGIGSNSDSFYEYLLKAYLLFRKKEMYGMFSDAYTSIKRFVQVGDWFSDVDMFNGKLRRNRVENLHAFWPGLEASLGFSHTGARQLNSFYSVWTSLGYLPEEFDNVEWLKGKNSMHPYYPLRPELIESTYMQYRTTRDRSWLAAGLVFVNSVERTRTSCGFASVSNMDTMELADSMPSFFLSETLKYLYLLFDEDNFVHERAYIFSTEAHPFDPTQLPKVYREEEEDGSLGEFEGDLFNSTAASFKASSASFSLDDEMDGENENEGEGEEEDEDGSGDTDVSDAADTDADGGRKNPALSAEAAPEQPSAEMLPVQCSRRLWWDSADSFVFNYIVPPTSGTGGDDQNAAAPAKVQSKVQSSWQLKLLSGSAPLPSALSMLMNIINAGPKQSQQAAEAGSSADDGGGGSSWESVFAMELAQQRTVSRLRKSSKAMRQLELRGQYDESAAATVAAAGLTGFSTRFAPFGQSLSELSMEGPDGSTLGVGEEPVAAGEEETAKKAKKGKKSKSSHSVGMGKGTATGGRAKGKRRPQTCYPEDSPSNAWANAPAPPGAIQTVEISMGPLGDFTVHVYSDGFLVRSRTDGDSLEISNVGHDLMFVRDSNEHGSTTVIGDMSGQTISCQVTVRVDDDDADESGDGGDGEAKVAEDPRKEIWRRSCSLAAFGGSEAPRTFLNYEEAQTKREKRSGRGLDTFAPPTVPTRVSHFSMAPSELSEVDTMCSLPSAYQSAAPRVAKKEKADKAEAAGGGAAAGASEPGEGGLLDALSSFLFGEGVGEAKADARRASLSSSPDSAIPASAHILAGKVAVARRGDCMFQEKATVARKAGAEALVVINNENNVFIMSGQSDGGRGDEDSDADSGEASDSDDDDDDSGSGSDESTPAAASVGLDEAEVDSKTLTTVMLSSSDGADLLHTLARAREEPHPRHPMPRSVRVGVEISSKDMTLDSSLLGAMEYPKLRLKRNLIHVIGRGRWGCILTSQNGGEWQLFIQRKEDLTAVNIWPTVVTNSNGELMTITPVLTNNPVEFYSGLLSRTCPKGLSERAQPYVNNMDGEDPPHLVTLNLGPPVGSAVSSDGVTLD